MENYFYSASVLCIIFFICKFIEMRFITKSNKSLKELMTHYRVRNKAEIISKALAVLKIASHIDKTNGELFARKGGHETKIIVR